MVNPLSWLQSVADARPQPLPPRGAPAVEHVTERRETCRVESVDGFKLLKCTETRELLRQCRDGHREVVEHSTTTTVRPYDPCTQAAAASTSGSTSYEDPALAPVISATLGQMLDDFFEYATDLQASLEQQGVNVSAAAAASPSERHSAAAAAAAAADRSWATGGSSSGAGMDDSGSGSSSSSSRPQQAGVFSSWWQRRAKAPPEHTAAADAAAAAGAGSAAAGAVGSAGAAGQQPSLQQLVRECSTEVLDI